MFTVFDVETTGLFPLSSNRIIEVGIVRLDADLNIIDEYDTLINPQRDIGPTSIHGITSGEIIRAPLFSEIVGNVLCLMKDSIIVGHKINFDYSFLTSELTRIGIELPKIPLLCTCSLAKKIPINFQNYKLNTCCKMMAINHNNVHSALGDAKATADFLKVVKNRFAEIFSDYVKNAQDCSLNLKTIPIFEASQKRKTRSNCSVIDRGQNYLAKIVERLNHNGFSENTIEYTNFLGRVIEDRIVTADEAEQLYAIASTLGLSAEQVKFVHKKYVEKMIAVALNDGEINDIEYRDLQTIALILGVQECDLKEMITNITDSGCQPIIATENYNNRESFAGKKICFTGELLCEINGKHIQRSEAEKLASEKAGCIIADAVTKKLDILVCADADSLSGKARKAHAYGIRIIAERDFWSKIGVEID
jgi:DNA polymerase-3 subunit epsilon